MPTLQNRFLAIYLIAYDKRGISVYSLHKDIAVTYKTAWLILHKICNAMKARDAEYTLAGIVELGDAFFGAPSEGGKRGRGTHKTTVIVGLPLNTRGHPQYLKLAAIPDVNGNTLIPLAKQWMAADTTISSDVYHAYRVLSGAGF